MRLAHSNSTSLPTLALATVLGLALTAGCTTYTTPSAGFVTPQHQAVGQTRHSQQPYRATAQQPAPAMASTAHGSTAPGNSHTTPATTHAPSAPAHRTAAFGPQPAAPATAAFAHNSARDTVPVSAARPGYRAPKGGNPGQFNLYGQFDQHGTHRESPMDAQGNLSRITFTTEGADFDVEIDPAGQNLYFASTRHRETADIYRQKIGGTAVTQLTSDPANDVMPALSPDGRTIAFASDRSGTWDIYLMDSDGGQVVKLTNDDAHNIHPSFSRDGRQLVYSSYGSQAGVWELVLIDLNRPTKKRIIGHGLFPVWSPTDDTIVFQRARERGSRWFSVWTVNVVDGEAISPTEIAVSSNAAVITPEWSPDGQNIVFCTVIDPQNEDPAHPVKADVWVVNRDGSGRAKLTTGDFANLQPAWSPDGNIYFISDRGVEGIENIWAVKPAQAVVLAQTQRQPNVAEASVPTGP